MNIDINSNISEVIAAIETIAAKGANLEPLMAGIAEELIKGIPKNSNHGNQYF